MERKTGQNSSKKKSTRTPAKKSRKSSLKKPKVYISTYKLILLCAAVIAVCVILLVVSNVASKKSVAKTEEKSVITERFEEPKKVSEPAINQVNEKKSEAKKTVSVPVKTEVKKTEPKKPEEEKKSAPVQEIKKEEPQKTAQTPETLPVAQPAVQKTDFDFPKAVNGAQLVFVFDDGGQNLNHLEKFLSLPFPYTVAVLPQLIHSKDTAQKVRGSGNEVILHQPMQSVNHSINPGPGAITYEMTTDQVHRLLQKNIEEIWPIAGLNNHEGSEITTDPEKIEEVLRTASAYGIYFLDSRTNVETVVPEVAQAMGYHYYERNIFLDNEKTRSNILSELKKGLGIANKNGVVIMIGHVWSADILPDILKEVYPELKAKGYTFSVVSESKARK